MVALSFKRESSQGIRRERFYRKEGLHPIHERFTAIQTRLTYCTIQIYRGGAENAEGMFFCSNRETAIGAQTPPLGIRSNPFPDMAPIVGFPIKDQKSFCLSASPDKQKLSSLRARRLCGEISILGKHVKAFLVK